MNRPFFWKDNGILSSFLIPISFIYYSISKLHYYLKKKYISDIPIVSVGSPLIGGGGKTPVVIAILNFLIANQKNPCALAKGYKGSIKIPTLINNKHSVKDVGDEPLLISKTIDTYVSKKRKDALEVIKNNTYDQFYDEHVYVFSVLAITKISEKFNLRLFDVDISSVHGGSIRYFICKKDSNYKNTLRCYEIKNGNECWNLKTEDSFTISNSKLSLIIVDDLVVFSNSIGDITAADIETGLIIWQLPTQSSSIINETYNFKISKLVSDGSFIYFSNNRNEIYSVDLKNGIINWKNEISSSITPVITGNLIFTVSEDGYLLAIEKNKGNIIRVTDLLKNYKLKKRKDIKPVGFAIDDTTLYLTNSDGKMILADLSIGNIKTIEKVSGDFVSRPFIFNQNLFVIRNGSIVQYN